MLGSNTTLLRLAQKRKRLNNLAAIAKRQLRRVRRGRVCPGPRRPGSSILRADVTVSSGLGRGAGVDTRAADGRSSPPGLLEISM